MTKYLKKGAEINVSDRDYINAFKKLKLLLTTDSILIYPDYSKSYYIIHICKSIIMRKKTKMTQVQTRRPYIVGKRTALVVVVVVFNSVVSPVSVGISSVIFV